MKEEQAKNAIKWIDVKDMDSIRSLLLAYESHCRKKLLIEEEEGDKFLIEDFLSTHFNQKST